MGGAMFPMPDLIFVTLDAGEGGLFFCSCAVAPARWQGCSGEALYLGKSLSLPEPLRRSPFLGGGAA